MTINAIERILRELGRQQRDLIDGRMWNRQLTFKSPLANKAFSDEWEALIE